MLRSTLLAGACASACAGAPPPPTAVPAEQAAPLPALSYPLRDGGTWTSAALAGKVAVIDVWATYCAPCKHAFPHLNDLAADPTVAVLGLSVDEDDAAVDAFLAEVPARFPIGRDPTQTVEGPPLGVHPSRAAGEKPLQLLDVVLGEPAAGLRVSGGCPPRGQGLPGQGVARAQGDGITKPAPGLLLRDAEPDPQGFGPGLGPDPRGCGLVG